MDSTLKKQTQYLWSNAHIHTLESPKLMGCHASSGSYLYQVSFRRRRQHGVRKNNKNKNTGCAGPSIHPQGVTWEASSLSCFGSQSHLFQSYLHVRVRNSYTSAPSSASCAPPANASCERELSLPEELELSLERFSQPTNSRGRETPRSGAGASERACERARTARSPRVSYPYPHRDVRGREWGRL